MASETSSGIWKDSQHLLHTHVTVCSQQLSIPTVTHESKRIPVACSRSRRGHPFGITTLTCDPRKTAGWNGQCNRGLTLSDASDGEYAP